MSYILVKYGSDKLAPPQSEEKLYLRYSYWMHFAEGTAMPTFFNSMLVNIAQSKAPYLIRPIGAYLFSGLHTNICEIFLLTLHCSLLFSWLPW